MKIKKPKIFNKNLMKSFVPQLLFYRSNENPPHTFFFLEYVKE